MPTWSDNPATRDTPIRYGHINELREWVERRRSAYSAPTGGWQPPAWSNGARLDSNDPIRAIHFTELRTAIQQLWDQAVLGAIGPWTRRGETRQGRDVPTGGTPIYADDINDLRGWFDTYENSLAVQGADSLSYDPQTGGSPKIGAAWADALRALLPGKSYLVRCNIIGTSHGLNDVSITTTDRDSYRDAFLLYQARGVQVFSLFGLQSYQSPAASPGDTLSSPPAFSNAYVDAFSDQVATVAGYLYDNTSQWVRDVLIWNEPNVPGNAYLDQMHFAAMLRQCRIKLQATGKPIRMYWGGVESTTKHEPDIPYIDGVYHALSSRSLAPPWPWDGINVHIHHNWTTAELVSQFNAIETERASVFDSSGLIVGEWGVAFTDEEGDPGGLRRCLDGIKPRVDRMFYFAHQYVREPPPPDPVEFEWGIQYYTTSGGQFVPTTTTELYAPYTAAVRA